jgi:hypothetical protein
MSNHPLSRRDTDRILDAPVESGHPVAEVLEALGAPGAAPELRREDAVVADFRAARLAPATRSRREMSPTTPRTAAVRAMAATGLVVALTSGGFALAADGHLPTLPDQASDRATEAVAARSTSPSESASETAAEEASPTANASESTETTTADPAETADETVGETETTAPPTPNLEGLCKAFQASDKAAHGKALDSAAFTALATAAGGKDGIATYCVTLVGEPTATGRPTSLPTQATGKPTTVPTPAAPTGKPTTVPSPTDRSKPSSAGRPDGPGKPETAGKH